MAKKHSLGGILFFGAVSAVAGGVVAYRHREDITKIMKDMVEKLDASEDEDGFFTVDLSGSSRIGEDAGDQQSKEASDPSAANCGGEPDSDFADLHDESQFDHAADAQRSETNE